MADTKISALQSAASAALDNELPVNEAGASKKVTVSQIISLVYPVGSIYTSISSTDPNTLFGFGAWVAFGSGRVLIGLDSGDADFDVSEETGGAKTVTLTAAQSGLPQHTHVQNEHLHQTLRERSATTGGATTLIARTSDTSSTVDTNVFTGNATAVNQDAGPSDASEAHSNVQPYIVVYFFKRTE